MWGWGTNDPRMIINDEDDQDLLQQRHQRAAEERPKMSSKDSTKNTIISAVSNLSTAYNLTVIGIAHVFIENQYCGGDFCPEVVEAASTSCLVGAIMGQLTFGYIGDCLGRGPALRLTMALSIFGALLSAFAVPINDDPSSIFIFLAITRFLLGLGVGGVYPLSATIAAESASTTSRGRSSAIVFSMQGPGYLLCPLLAMLFLQITGEEQWRDWVSSEGHTSGLAWRLSLGFGAVPGLLLVPFKTVETKRPTGEPAASATGASSSSSSLSLAEALCMRQYWGKLLGCAGGWFLFDITFYGNSLFQSTVLRKVFHVAVDDDGGDGDDGMLFNSTTVGDDDSATPISGGLKTNVCAQMAVVYAIALPGYYVAAYFMDSLGRRFIQLQVSQTLPALPPLPSMCMCPLGRLGEIGIAWRNGRSSHRRRAHAHCPSTARPTGILFHGTALHHSRCLRTRAGDSAHAAAHPLLPHLLLLQLRTQQVRPSLRGARDATHTAPHIFPLPLPLPCPTALPSFFPPRASPRTCGPR